MIKKIFSVFDSKAEIYIDPFMMIHDGEAKRAFGYCITNETHQFSRSPQDYTLFHISNFDDNTGQLMPNNAPISLGNGVEFINSNYEGVKPNDQIRDDTQVQ